MPASVHQVGLQELHLSSDIKPSVLQVLVDMQ